MTKEVANFDENFCDAQPQSESLARPIRESRRSFAVALCSQKAVADGLRGNDGLGESRKVAYSSSKLLTDQGRKRQQRKIQHREIFIRW